MKTIIHQALGDVLFADPRLRLDRTQINDALVRDAVIAAAVEQRERATQLLRQIIRAEDRHFTGIRQLRAHHRDVHPADRQNTCAAPRRGADSRVLRVRPFQRDHRVVGHKRRQMGAHANRPHAWTATAMRDTERFVQVHVRHIGTDVCWPGQPDLGVEVGAIHVHLAAMAVNNLADIANAFFIHAMGRGIGDHQARQRVPRFLRLGFQVSKVNVTRLVALNDHHVHAGHLSRCRVGAMRRRRDKANLTLILMTAQVVFVDRQQPGIFALRAGVGLHANSVETGDRAQPGFEFVNHGGVTERLFTWNERMQIGELGPGNRDHFAGGVEFHGARTEGNH